MRWLIVFIFLILISTAGAVQISISPGELDFNANSMEVVCKQATVYFSEEVLVTGEDRWANLSIVSRNLNDYKYTAENIGISISYPKDVNQNNKKINICVGGIKNGVYQGALIYSTDSTAGVGAWITVNIGNSALLPYSKNSNNSSSPPSTTDSSTQDQSGDNQAIDYSWIIVLLMFLPTVALFIVLIYLMKVNRRIKKEKENYENTSEQQIEVKEEISEEKKEDIKSNVKSKKKSKKE
jgi:hypothetical protein